MYYYTFKNKEWRIKKAKSLSGTQKEQIESHVSKIMDFRRLFEFSLNGNGYPGHDGIKDLPNFSSTELAIGSLPAFET